jgi:RNA polymerase sigma-70 factor (ECF subfamily)
MEGATENRPKFSKSSHPIYSLARIATVSQLVFGRSKLEHSAVMDIALEAEGWRADQIPFEQIVRQHSSMVYSIAFHYLRDRGLSEDIAQEAFLRLSHNLKTIKSEKHLALWLRRAAIRLCIDERRKFFKRHTTLESIPEPTLEQPENDFLADEQIRKMVAELPGESRMALILRYQEDMQPSEIAELLDEPVNTIKSRLHRALGSLRQKLAPIVALNAQEEGDG